MGSAVFWRLSSCSVIIKAENALCSEEFDCEGWRGWDNVPLCIISNVEMKTCAIATQEMRRMSN